LTGFGYYGWVTSVGLSVAQSLELNGAVARRHILNRVDSITMNIGISSYQISTKAHDPFQKTPHVIEIDVGAAISSSLSNAGIRHWSLYPD
jgi:hypothetical protein